MSTVEDIESAVTRLSPVDYARFREWVLEFDNQLWDEQMAADADAGRLDGLAAEAVADYRSGRSTDL